MTNLFRRQEKESREGRIVSVGVEKIRTNPRQPRREFDHDAMRSLSESIQVHGILQPIVVRTITPRGEQMICGNATSEISLVSDTVYLPGKTVRKAMYEIIAGERRFRAAQMAGLSEVPCIILECDEKVSAQLAIVENIQRRDLNPFEEAAAIASLLDLEPLTQEQIARRLSVTQSYIANKLRLLKLGSEVRERILANHLTERHARALLKLETDEERLSVLKTIIAHSLNVAQTEEMIKRRLAQREAERTPSIRAGGGVRDLRLFYNTIEHALDTITRAGVTITRERREDSEAVEYLIRLPK